MFLQKIVDPPRKEKSFFSRLSRRSSRGKKKFGIVVWRAIYIIFTTRFSLSTLQYSIRIFYDAATMCKR